MIAPWPTGRWNLISVVVLCRESVLARYRKAQNRGEFWMSGAISKPVTAVSAPVTHSSAHCIGRPRAQLELEREKTDQKASRVPWPTFFRRDAF